MSNVRGVDAKCWIVALIIRSDKERLLLGDGGFEFTDAQQHFTPDTFSNTVIDVQGGDGSLLSGQVRRASVQSFDGYIGDGGCSKNKIESLRREFLSFFKPNYLYEVVYVFADGSAVKRQRGFIVDAPSVQELYQIHPLYHVGLSFEDVDYYTYMENSNGDEIYGQLALIPCATSTTGGFVWDNTGLVWDSNGTVCDGGAVGNTIIQNQGATKIYPIWTVVGPSAEPKLENVSTGQSIKISGHNVASRFDDFVLGEGQIAVVDMLQHTATLYASPNDTRGSNILPYIEGDWLTLATGRNELSYSTANQNAVDSRIEWAEVAW